MNTSNSTPNFEYESLPEALRLRPAFVVWKLETVEGRDKPTKVPYNAGKSQKASATDSLTWTGFDEAITAYRTGDYSGVGYVFSSGDPFTFIDLDRAIDPDERVRLHAEGSDDPLAGLKPWARFVRDIYDYAYVALSQSGTGLHVIVRGKLPATGRSKVERDGEPVGEIEMYDQGRFVALTGRTL